VRGVPACRFKDTQQDTIEILKHVVIPEPDDEIATGFDHLRPFGVQLDGVLAAIEFDYQFGVGAEKVDREAVDRRLPPEFPAIKLAIAQP